MIQKKKLAEYFDGRLFITEMEAENKSEAIKELVEVLSAAGRIKDKALILEMLERREALGSTGIGHGVAIPHGRSLAANQLMVVFGRSSKGIPFEAVDGEPVHLFFLILAPPQDRFNQYLPFLGKIVELIKEDSIRDKIMKAEGFEDFIAVISEGREDA